MNKNDICKMINDNDFSIIKNVYFKISIKAFTEYFANITHLNDYYHKIFNELLKIANEELDDMTKDTREERLTIGAMVMIAESMIRRSHEYDQNIPRFIIEKIFVEPLVVLGNELHSNKIITN